MARILHCSDVHLERRFRGATMTAEEAARRREELRAVLRRIVDLALQYRVDALTIAGDLYEHEHATDETGAFLAAQFRRLTSTPVLVAPGNHDPYITESLYQRVEWPNNVTVFSSSEWRPVRVFREVRVWGIGHDGPAMSRDVLRELRLEGGDTAILLFHGADVSRPARADAAQCPFQAADVQRAGADFALVGHEHTWRRSSTVAYPGSPEPLGFFTEGPHYAALATISAGSILVERVPTSRVTYQTIEVDVSGVANAAVLRRALAAELSNVDPMAIVRVVLSGERAFGLQPKREALSLAGARRLRYVEVVDETRVAPGRVRRMLPDGASAVRLPLRPTSVVAGGGGT